MRNFPTLVRVVFSLSPHWEEGRRSENGEGSFLALVVVGTSLRSIKVNLFHLSSPTLIRDGIQLD